MKAEILEGLIAQVEQAPRLGPCLASGCVVGLLVDMYALEHPGEITKDYDVRLKDGIERPVTLSGASMHPKICEWAGSDPVELARLVRANDNALTPTRKPEVLAALREMRGA